MFINTTTGDLLTYQQLQALEEFSRVGWPSDETVSGIDDRIAPAYARLTITDPPEVAANEVVFLAGGELHQGSWRSIWQTRPMTEVEFEDAQTAIKFPYENAVQMHMDAAAKRHGYDNIMTAVSYAEENAVPKFQAEGQAFRAWRSLCWAYCYAQLEAVMTQARAQPTVEDFVAELPPAPFAPE